MNSDAARENEHNKRHVQLHGRRGKLVLEIDRKQVRYNGRSWLNLSDYDRRKFENKLFMQFNKAGASLIYLYV